MKVAKSLPLQYQLGIKSIDNQHTEILALVEETLLATKLSEATRPSSVDDIISRMKKYGQNHFSYEDKFMMKIGFPNLKEHRLKHKDFEQYIMQYSKNPNRYVREEVMKLAVFLKNWFLDHINKEDRAYADHYNKLKLKGVLTETDNE